MDFSRTMIGKGRKKIPRVAAMGNWSLQFEGLDYGGFKKPASSNLVSAVFFKSGKSRTGYHKQIGFDKRFSICSSMVVLV